MRFTIEKPLDIVENPTSLGEHLKRRRLQAKMRQVDAARVLGANTWTYITWEKHAAEPTAQFVPRLIAWLGYDPFPVGETFGAKIRWKRRKAGLTRCELGDRLGVSYATIQQWERDVCKPRLENLRKVERLIGDIDTSEGGGD